VHCISAAQSQPESNRHRVFNVLQPAGSGHLIVTIAEVAELAGVSRSAVSRTYTEGASVSAKTRAKVERAAAELGYVPNVIARSLATRRTQLVGLVIDNFQNPIFMQVLNTFTRSFQSSGLRPLLVNLSGEVDPEQSLQMLRAYRVDAVIVASSTLPQAFSHAFNRAGLPVVNVFGRYTPDPDVPVVGIDNRHAGALAATTLLERGYNKIAFLGGPENATSTQDRLSGFLQQMQTRDCQPVQTIFARSYSYDAGFEAMQALSRRLQFDAVFCGDDIIAIGAMAAAREANLSIPEQVGVLGFNDIEIADWHAFELSTIAQPVEALCEAAVSMVIELLKNPSRIADTRLFPCELVERGTLRALG